MEAEYLHGSNCAQRNVIPFPCSGKGFGNECGINVDLKLGKKKKMTEFNERAFGVRFGESPSWKGPTPAYRRMQKRRGTIANQGLIDSSGKIPS